ncbi:LacI family DNA-binding transcriptional regulator [Puniceibacterium sp. IMCC21224]|uniref:LacI family DNA-binding transcriptional regulator n=1 Tax=Puniceibacterium sp. IMCC21224 TaxID=1618204 RepID=UPI001E2BE0D2|nr:LacI family DNA-binding transcriptional regulator [Puniceibacterium sp. IMCC21224]
MLRPTTKDLAKVAGVSRATVDRVLNGREGVKQKTVDRVNAAIEQLGFVRNISAANLAKGKTYRFLFVLPKSGDLFLTEILRHIEEAETAFAADMVWADVHHVDENDPHRIASFLSGLSSVDYDGVAIMAPETPQVRDAMLRLQERGIRALPFISNQTLTGDHWVGIDNHAAGATAATLLGRFIHATAGRLLVVAESMQLRDSLERRLGFDAVINASFPHLCNLPSLETYGSADRAHDIISETFARNPDIVGAYILSSEARVPLAVLQDLSKPRHVVTIAHERTPFTEQALRDGTLDALVTQDPGHLVRSAIRKLRAMADMRNTLKSQEKIRVEVLLAANL